MIIRGGKRTQCTGHCAVLVLWNPPSSLFSPNSNQFCNVTWPLLPSSPISLSLLIVVIFLSSSGCKVLLSCLLIFTSSICTLSVHFLFETPSCSCLCPPLASENLFVGLVLLPTPPTPTYVISSCACGWLLYLFSPVFVVSFLSLGLLVCSLFSAHQPKTNSPSLMYNKVIIIGKHGICSLIVLPGRWVGCQSFLIPN